MAVPRVMRARRARTAMIYAGMVIVPAGRHVSAFAH
jgi:hypothetical protein